MHLCTNHRAAAHTQLEPKGRGRGRDLLIRRLGNSPVRLWVPPGRPRSSSSFSRVRSAGRDSRCGLGCTARRLEVLFPKPCASRGGGKPRSGNPISLEEQLRGSLHYVVSEGNLIATCSANAWPSPVISWIVPKAESEKTEVVTHPNGTVSVISKLCVNSTTSLAGQSLICRVRHMEEERYYSVKVKEDHGRWFSVPWLLATVALLVVCVVLVLTVVCWRRRRKKQNESRAS
ncbi:OX-2 membrane glycoprotein-like isoform 2-T2 [Macrochelys suwanniensis]